jgi:hypothetical protein
MLLFILFLMYGWFVHGYICVLPNQIKLQTKPASSTSKQPNDINKSSNMRPSGSLSKHKWCSSSTSKATAQAQQLVHQLKHSTSQAKQQHKHSTSQEEAQAMQYSITSFTLQLTWQAAAQAKESD